MLLRKLVLLLCLCRTFRISNITEFHCYLRHAHKIYLSSFQDTNDVSGELKWTRKSDLYAYNCCPRAVIKEMIISCCSLVWVLYCTLRIEYQNDGNLEICTVPPQIPTSKIEQGPLWLGDLNCMPRTKNLGPVRAFANYDVIERMRICLPLKRGLQIRDFSAEKRPVPE